MDCPLSPSLVLVHDGRPPDGASPEGPFPDGPSWRSYSPA